MSDLLRWTPLLAIAACGFPRPADITSCTPSAFADCTGDTAQVCNAAGNGYDTVQCARGCDSSIGCRLCDADQTVCTNGTVQSCDATGTVISSESCPLGCFEDQPRCREIDPSNGLGAALAMAAAGPDMVIADATLSLPSAMLTMGNQHTKLASTTVSGAQDGVPIQVFVVRTLSMTGNVRIVSDGTGVIPAIAFVVERDVTLNGTIVLDSDGFPPPGAIDAGPCTGQDGLIDVAGEEYVLGGGGGGAATPGGNGGGQAHPARLGGAAFPNPDLQPLRGGCTGGSPPWSAPGFGGGAIQITSRSMIHLGVNATIQANGLVGYTSGPPQGLPGTGNEPGGGGGGGGILLEAPVVTLDAGATLVANGGAGTSGSWDAGNPGKGRTPSTGVDCRANTPDICTRGGDGGSSAATNNSAPSIAFQGQQQLLTGAGGGGVGYIRINTASGVYAQANDVFTSPIPSIGTIATK